MEDLSDFTIGPLKLLTEIVMNYTQILIDIEGNRRLIAHVIGFDSHFNMVLTNVKEMWSEKCGRRGIVEIKKGTLLRCFYLVTM